MIMKFYLLFNSMLKNVTKLQIIFDSTKYSDT